LEIKTEISRSEAKGDQSEVSLFFLNELIIVSSSSAFGAEQCLFLISEPVSRDFILQIPGKGKVKLFPIRQLDLSMILTGAEKGDLPGVISFP
jgi:hypothetical protein